jgi:hypothetical protein
MIKAAEREQNPCKMVSKKKNLAKLITTKQGKRNSRSNQQKKI